MPGSALRRFSFGFQNGGKLGRTRSACLSRITRSISGTLRGNSIPALTPAIPAPTTTTLRRGTSSIGCSSMTSGGKRVLNGNRLATDGSEAAFTGLGLSVKTLSTWATGISSVVATTWGAMVKDVIYFKWRRSTGEASYLM